MRGPHELVGEKGEMGAAWSGQATASWAERCPPRPRRMRERGGGAVGERAGRQWPKARSRHGKGKQLDLLQS